jgi:hypothetical protein
MDVQIGVEISDGLTAITLFLSRNYKETVRTEKYLLSCRHVTFFLNHEKFLTRSHHNGHTRHKARDNGTKT